MSKNPKKYLFDISESIRIILDDYLKGIDSFEAYDVRYMVQDAVERRIIIIAEALYKLRQMGISLPSGDQIINRRKIWLSIHRELPALKSEVDKLLAV